MTDIINTWIELAKRGDREAFERLLEEHYEMILRVAWRFCGNKEEAEDIAQDVCIALADKIHRFDGNSRFSSWLYRVVINTCKDRFKSRTARKQRERNFGEIEQHLREEQSEMKGQLAWVYEQIATMESKLRDTALLVLAEGLSHQEVGDILECEESTISWRMYEIRKLLKDAWGGTT